MSVSSLPFLQDALAAVLPKLAAWRRDFHAHPEAGWTEFRTAALIIRRLHGLGYAIRMGEAACAPGRRMGVPSPAVLEAARERALGHGADAGLVAGMGDGYTGFWADLDCGPGPVTAFRFDMDCNEVVECAEGSHRPAREGFASRWPGLMHACGHDGHAAVGLGLAEVLVSIRRRLRGRIRLIFQPAEEGARGALPMAEAGAVDGVDALFGFHIGFKAEGPGILICGTQGFLATTKRDVFFSGVPAHAGAAPEEGKDALLAACSAVVSLHAISRNGKGGTRIAVGRLEGGEARNVIPASARLFMETRGETTELDAYMVAESERILRASADLWGCACEWRMTKLYKVTGNHLYLDKLYEYIVYSDSIMLDRETCPSVSCALPPICGAAPASGGLWGTAPGERAARSLPASLLRLRKRWAAGRRSSRWAVSGRRRISLA